jgi:3-hydroxyacyl-[acyl-carrier-protein] dehydratase
VINTKSPATELFLQVPAEHACYADHFANNPLVPGALLLKWIMALMETELQCRLTHIKQIKFLAAVKPADHLRIVINSDAAGVQYSLAVFVGATTVIKGVMQTDRLAPNESVND